MAWLCATPCEGRAAWAAAAAARSSGVKLQAGRSAAKGAPLRGLPEGVASAAGGGVMVGALGDQSRLEPASYGEHVRMEGCARVVAFSVELEPSLVLGLPWLAPAFVGPPMELPS